MIKKLLIGFALIAIHSSLYTSASNETAVRDELSRIVSKTIFNRMQFERKKREDKVYCDLRPVGEIAFKKYGFDIVKSPEKINVGYCDGSCSTLDRELMSKHANMILRLARQNPDLKAPLPCCVPIDYDPLRVTITENGEDKVVDMNDLIIKECGCR